MLGCGLGSPLRGGFICKVRFATTFFFAFARKERHPPAPLLLLSNCDPLRWARNWQAALRAAFFMPAAMGKIEIT